MLPPSTLDQMPDAFVQLWQQVEEQILQDVARRIGKMDKVTGVMKSDLIRPHCHILNPKPPARTIVTK